MVHVWPADDTFDHGTPVYGSTLLGYLGVQPESGGGQTDWVAACRMSSAYGTGTCVMVPKTGDADAGNDAAGVMRRQLFAEDQKVSVATRLQIVTGTLLEGQFKRAAVFARVQGGTLLEAVPHEAYYHDVDCYAFIAEYLTDTTLRFKISRYNAGVETVLATADGSATAQDFFHSDVVMALEATTVGAQVDLIATVSGLNVGGIQPPITITPGGSSGGLPTYGGTPGVGTQVDGLTLSGRPGIKGPYTPDETVSVITFSDTNASRVVGSGRCGFAVDRPRDHGVDETVALVLIFQVEESAVVVWRDAFERAALGLGGGISDIFSNVGSNLGSDYASDAHSKTIAADMLTRDTTENVEQASSLDFGKGIEFDGTANHSIEHNNAPAIYPGSVPSLGVELTITCWADLDTNRDGHIVFGNLYAATPFEGIECAIGSGTGANMKMRMRLGGAAALLTVNGDDFAELLNQRVFFAWTYKANANVATGEGRVRFWYSLGGGAMVDAGEVITVPSTQRPIFQTDQVFYMGRDIHAGTPSASNRMDGVLDDVTYYSYELSEAQLQTVADPLADIEDLVALGVRVQLDFEEQIAGGTNFYRPNYPTGVSDANSWEENGTPDPVWGTGLKPTGIPLISWAQRPVTNPEMQTRSVRVQFDGALSIAGIILRGSPTINPANYSGYRFEVGPGTPARLEVFRVINGVASKLARQAAAGLINVSTGIYTKLEFAVDQFMGVAGGPVQLLAEINDVGVVFEVVGNGAFVDDNNVLMDQGSSRILNGPAEGFLTATDTLPTLIDDWVQGTVVPPQPDPDDFESLLFNNEFDLVSNTSLESVITSEWSITAIQNTKRVEHVFDSGHRQRSMQDPYARRTFHLRRTIDGSNSEFSDLVDFWDLHRAGEVAFDFDPSVMFPNIGSAGIFIFDDALDIRRFGRNWTCEFTVTERVSAS